ncbi:MAG: dehydrogenase/reductase SDR family protein 12 [Myxococcota bacterium]
MFDRLLDRSIVFSFDRTGFRRHARSFATESERNLQGRDVLITGGSTGIGFALAQALSEKGACCMLWARRQETGEQAAVAVKGQFASVDLGDLTAVGQASHAYSPKALAAVVLNAGAMPLDRRLTPQDHELIWASQVLGHLLILRILRQRGLLGEQTRVIWVSSGGMYTQRLDLSDLRRDRSYQRHSVYANAKRAQVVLSSHLATEWPDVPIASMHPGWVQTDAVKHSMPLFHALTRPILRTPHEGADTLVWLTSCAQSPSTGRFWFDRAVQPEHLRDKTRATSQTREAFVAQVMSQTQPFLEAP